jgi:hypothetical protein
MKKLLLALFVFLAPPAFGQTRANDLFDAPKAKHSEEPKNRPYDQPKLKIKVEREPRVADRNFWLLVGASGGASALATAGGIHCRHGNGVEVCTQSYGTFAAFEGIRFGASTLLVGVIAYMWKQDNVELGARHGKWWIVPAIAIAANGWYAAREFRQGCRNGTVRLPNGKCP